MCLSHLRWDFVYQRPQHLMSRCARQRRVFFVEEPLPGVGQPYLEVGETPQGVHLVVPRLPAGLTAAQSAVAQSALLDELFATRDIREYVLWYYTPMALAFTQHLTPAAVVYDCMDELSAFAGAPPALRLREAELLQKADLVFTGGRSLYESKRRMCPQVRLFPSSVDAAHFARARQLLAEPVDQTGIPHPRLGFFGVLDERLDLPLLQEIADARPTWQLVLLGPVAKIDPATLPRRANVHYLGSKSYADLPAYLSGWDVAMLPFARNDATRFISPTKTPEYLAAGKPVVSTSIRDVVRPYGEQGLVQIADTPTAFVAAVEVALDSAPAAWLPAVDAFLAGTSWERTWRRMERLIDGVLASRDAVTSAVA